jgi:hypothetical protein
MQRLPKSLESDAAAEGMLGRIAGSSAPVGSAGAPSFPRGALAQVLEILRSARQRGSLHQGLESAQQRLQAERHGLALADQRSKSPRGERISRLVLCANDGSVRFYRDVEQLVREHSPRVLPVVLDVDGTRMGELILGGGRMARLLLVHHKQEVSAALLALFPKDRVEQR